MSSKANTELIYAIRKFSPVYAATAKGDTTSCPICKNDFLSPCTKCEAEDLTEPCPIQEGICGHVFHMHCISKWVSTNDNCPICNAKWEPKN